jgi:glyoxylase I family protein
MAERLHHIAILSSDKTRALRFYRDALGFAVVREIDRPERGDEIVWLQGAGVVLELFVAPHRPPRVSDPEAYGLRHIALCVDDVETAIDRIKACGFSPEPIRRDTFDGKKMTFVKDADGLPVELHE